jgi:hypothetical protein
MKNGNKQNYKMNEVGWGMALMRSAVKMCLTSRFSIKFT